MDWEQLFQRWEIQRSLAWDAINALRSDKHEIDAALDALEAEAFALLQNYPLPDTGWLLSALKGTTEEDERRRHFIRIVLRRADQIPSILFQPLLRAAVHERDPSFNRLFIEPCLRSEGRRRVNEELLRYLENGTNEEKGGAASAFYWSLMLKDGVKEENINDLFVRIYYLFLTEFVANEDVHVRRRILPMLLLKADRYPEYLHPLVSQAIQIARQHEDEYIRHRVEIQLGGAGPYLPLPK